MVGVLRVFLLLIQRRAFTPEGENRFWRAHIFYLDYYPKPTYKDGFRRCCFTLASTIARCFPAFLCFTISRPVYIGPIMMSFPPPQLPDNGPVLQH